MNHAQQIQAREAAAVVLYTKPGCQPCRITKAKLNQSDIDFTEVDVTEDPAALHFVKEVLGYQGAPVVYVSAIEGDAHWYGLDVAKIETHITKRADAA